MFNVSEKVYSKISIQQLRFLPILVGDYIIGYSYSYWLVIMFGLYDYMIIWLYNYMIRDEVSTYPAATDFTISLHVEIKFHPGKLGQFCSWYLFRFIYIFFKFSFESMCLITFSFRFGGLKQLHGKISSQQSGIPAVKKRDTVLLRWNFSHVMAEYSLWRVGNTDKRETRETE